MKPVFRWTGQGREVTTTWDCVAREAVTSIIESFIARWQGREGGQERANYGMFLPELCDVLGVPRPDPAAATTAENDYVLERAVKEALPDGSVTTKRIDLYKRGCFVLEAKQSRQPGGAKEVPMQADLFGGKPARKVAPSGFDVLMRNALRQALSYARDLPADHGWPPFILVCDIGNIIEVWADFSGFGKNYVQFPDRQGFRVTLDQLRDEAIRDRLRRIWLDPHSLDPAKVTARVTRAIAGRLAAVSRALDAAYPRETVALFLMRCLFTMFAEDIGLLPAQSFKAVLERCERKPEIFVPVVGALWEAMDRGGFAHPIEAPVKRFNGSFFRDHTVLPLGAEEIGELRRAAGYDWREVDPSIFGTLLEQALDPEERKSLGAHYTPRAYVERLVVATVIEPLQQEWVEIYATAERQRAEGRGRDAIATIAAFAERLAKLRVLDPACGTGNFLYVALELLKRLEGDVLDVLNGFGDPQAQALEFHTIDPHQFLGIETNPRAARIAELVLWIGYLQWHARTRNVAPNEPILQAFRNIETRDALLAREGEDIRRAEWPKADFIVGNPPFIGGSLIRARLGDDYAEALWAAHPQMNPSADFVMYWWDHAAELLTRKGTALRRFGFVTTNSITQVFQRRTVERHLSAKRPVSLILAVADHPWTRATKDAAAVRIAMTVAEAGKREGVLLTVTNEAGLETDAPEIQFESQSGTINADLTIGADVSSTRPLLANKSIAHDGVKLHGAGFIVKPVQAEHLGLGRRPGLEAHIRDYRNGRDLTARPRGAMVIDLFGLSAAAVRAQYPEVYQHLLATVKPERDANNRASYKENWWIFGEPRKDLRPALAGLTRYIATVDTAKHRVFQFLSPSIICDDKVVLIASSSAFHLGVLCSHIHVTWALRTGGWLGFGNDAVYVKSRCFDPFPFPEADAAQQAEIGAIAEEIDGLRKRVLAEHSHLTLTGLYNIRETLRAGADPRAMQGDERRVFDDGLVLILDELHRRLDGAVASAYGWPENFADEAILAGLVALNRARGAEEARGAVRWLRPDYQIRRFGSAGQKLDLAGGELRAEAGAAERRAWPSDEVAQTAEIMAALAATQGGLGIEALALLFKGRALRPKIETVLAGLLRLGLIAPGAGGYRIRRVA